MATEMQTPREMAERKGDAGAGMRYSLSQPKAATTNPPVEIKGGRKQEISIRASIGKCQFLSKNVHYC